MVTADVEQSGSRWCVTVYRDGAFDHRAWFGTDIAAYAYAGAVRS